MIQGVSVSFMVAASLALFALVLSFFIKPMKTTKVGDDKEEVGTKGKGRIAAES